MPIQFQCPHCDVTLKAPAAKSGARARCKKCNEIVTIPAADEPAKRVATSQSAPAKSDSFKSAGGETSTPVGTDLPNPPHASTFEPDFGAITANLPSFVAGQTASTENADPANDSAETGNDAFANLPEFQTLDAPVAKSSSTDADFHRMMLADSGQVQYAPESVSESKAGPLPGPQTPGPQTPGPQTPGPQTPTTPAPDLDHADLAAVLGGLDATIQSAVQQQRTKDQRAASAKFTVAQIQAAFAKPLGKVDRLPGLRRKQLQSAIAVALVPLGFVAFVILSSFGMLILFRSWMHDDSEGVLHPVIGMTFVVFAIFLLACWVPTINLLFAAFHLVLGRHRGGESVTQLTRQSQPVMYEFVDQICEKLGSPKPCRIDLDCDFNATASLRRGWLSSGQNDLVLTIGIPFIAIQTTEQLASVIAHEFGHFRQGSAMKTYYVIGSLTHWFMRTAYSGLGYFYWFGYLTHMLSGSLSREMEWDADRHAIQLAGTKAFEESSALLERYGVAYGVTVDNLIMLFQSGILVDNIPRFMMHIGRTMPASVVRRIAEETEKQRLDRLDSHPPTRDRVKAARKLQQPGILSLKRPATDLIDHWTPLCKKISLDYYAENLGLERNEIDESHVTPLEDLLRDEHKLLLDRAEK